MAVQINIGADVSQVTTGIDKISDALRDARQAALDLKGVDLSTVGEQPGAPRMPVGAHISAADYQAMLKMAGGAPGRITPAMLNQVTALPPPAAGIPNPFAPGAPVTGAPGGYPPGRAPGLGAFGPPPGAQIPAWAAAAPIGGFGYTPGIPPPPGGGGPGAPGGGGGAPPGGGGGAGQQPPGQPQIPAGLGALLGAGTPSLSMLGPALGVLGVGSIGAMLARSIQMAQEEGIAVDTLIRRINDSTTDFDHLRTSISDVTKGLGITAVESARLASIWARFSGDRSPEGIVSGAGAAGGFARAMGLEPDPTAAMLGRASFQGIDPARFAGLIAEATARTAQYPTEEIAAVFSRGLETLSRTLVTSGAIGRGMETFGGAFAGMIGPGADPGLRANAASVLDTINQTVTRGGNAGMAGQIFAMRSLAGAGVRDVYQQQELLEGGAFAQVRPGGPTVLQAELTQFNAEYGRLATGSPADQAHYRSVAERVFGPSMPLLAGLQRTFGQNLQGLTGNQLGESMRAMQARGLDITSQDFIRNAPQLIDIEMGNNLGRYREELLGRTRLDSVGNRVKVLPEGSTERTELEAATGEGLKAALERGYLAHGQAPTEASEMRQAMADLQSELTELGRQAIPPLTMVLRELVDLVKWLKSPADTLNNALEGAQSWGKSIGDATRRFLGIDQPGVHSYAGSPISDAASDYLEKFTITAATPLLGRNAALGIAANLRRESNFRKDAVGPGGSVGIPQWDSSRRKEAEAFIGKAWDQMTAEEQITAHIHELTGGSETAAGNTLRTARTPYQGGFLDATQDERPAWSWIRGVERGLDAEGLAKKYPAQTGAGGDIGTIRTEPLIVIHKSDTGDELGRQQLRTFTIPPQAANAPRSPSAANPAQNQPAPPPSAPPDMAIPTMRITPDFYSGMGHGAG